MRPPVIPETLAICRVCEEDLAVIGGLCPSCDDVKRCVAEGLAGELPPGARYVADLLSGTFVPEVRAAAEAMASSLETLAAEAALAARGLAPRIVEVPAALAEVPAGRDAFWDRLPKQPRREQWSHAGPHRGVAWRLIAWMGLAALAAYALGCALGRFA